MELKTFINRAYKLRNDNETTMVFILSKENNVNYFRGREQNNIELIPLNITDEGVGWAIPIPKCNDQQFQYDILLPSTSKFIKAVSLKTLNFIPKNRLANLAENTDLTDKNLGLPLLLDAQGFKLIIEKNQKTLTLDLEREKPSNGEIGKFTASVIGFGNYHLIFCFFKYDLNFHHFLTIRVNNSVTSLGYSGVQNGHDKLEYRLSKSKSYKRFIFTDRGDNQFFIDSDQNVTFNKEAYEEIWQQLQEKYEEKVPVPDYFDSYLNNSNNNFNPKITFKNSNNTLLTFTRGGSFAEILHQGDVYVDVCYSWGDFTINAL